MEYLLNFLGKDPQSLAEWRDDKTTVNVALGVLSELMREAVRGGFILGFNDVLGKK